MGHKGDLAKLLPKARSRKRLSERYDAIDIETDVLADEGRGLLHELERTKSVPVKQHLTQRIDEIHAAIQERGNEQREILTQLTAGDAPMLAHKVQALAEALNRKAPDRKRANAALRQLVRRVTVEYDAERLTLDWQHGGTSVLRYGGR
jgi:hypothetical protein